MRHMFTQNISRYIYLPIAITKAWSSIFHAWSDLKNIVSTDFNHTMQDGISRSSSPMIKYFSFLCQFNVQKWYKEKYTPIFPKNNLTQNGLIFKRLPTRGCIFNTPSYWCPSAKTTGHPYPQCCLNIHCDGSVTYRNITIIGNNIRK